MRLLDLFCGAALAVEAECPVAEGTLKEGLRSYFVMQWVYDYLHQETP